MKIGIIVGLLLLGGIVGFAYGDVRRYVEIRNM